MDLLGFFTDLLTGRKDLDDSPSVVSGRHYESNSPVSYSVRHQRPARERQKIRIASRKNVDNQAPHNTNFTN